MTTFLIALSILVIEKAWDEWRFHQRNRHFIKPPHHPSGAEMGYTHDRAFARPLGARNREGVG